MELVKSEFEIMEVLWNAGKPMTSDEILEELDGWLFIKLFFWENFLLREGAIQYAKDVMETCNYKSDGFVPAVSKEECVITEGKNINGE